MLVTHFILTLLDPESKIVHTESGYWSGRRKLLIL